MGFTGEGPRFQSLSKSPLALTGQPVRDWTTVGELHVVETHCRSVSQQSHRGGGGLAKRKACHKCQTQGLSEESTWPPACHARTGRPAITEPTIFTNLRPPGKRHRSHA